MIILINGSRNAGKSTTASLLVKKLPNSAHIEIDHFRSFFPGLHWEKTIPLNLEMALLATRHLVSKKFNVVLNYPLRNKDHYFVKNLKKLKVPVYCFTLKPDLKTALSKRGTRIPSLDDKNRIRLHYRKSSANYLPELGEVIDNGHKSVDEVVNMIIDHVMDR